jgi:hypothetical protein
VCLFAQVRANLQALLLLTFFPAIKAEIEVKMSMGSCHQEEPSENVCNQTASLLREMQASWQ